MTADVAARATEPFFSTKPLGKGTGLGLAQVYGIVRQSGGTLRIDSREGEGTTVRLLLPRADAGAAGEEAEAHAPGDGERPGDSGGARIFVVDDDPDVRDFLADILASLGHRVETMETGEAALAALADGPPDLMLIDFAMPGMNGAELAKAARARFAGLPIVFVTGFAESDKIEAAVGPDVPVLRKPFGIGQLSAVVAAELAEASRA
jgi:CheY-like chemotaxis protein